MNAIETRNLTKFYGRSRGIENLNLSVGEGEFFGFIGPNGAGKSTTIRLLLGLLHTSGGTAEIFGRSRTERAAVKNQSRKMPGGSCETGGFML